MRSPGPIPICIVPTDPLRATPLCNDPGRNMDRVRSSRIAYVVIAWGVVVALLVQVSLVGLWLFSGQPTLAIHKEFGHAIFLGVFALVIVAFTGRLTPRIKFVTALLS